MEQRQLEANLPLLLTRRQVAELAGVSVRTVIRWEQQGLLRQTMPGIARYGRDAVLSVLTGRRKMARSVA